MISRCLALTVLPLLLGAAVLVEPVLAKDYYVSASRGKGREGSKDKPAKDLGNIIKKLQAGDTVHIAAGTYLGRGKNGSDRITVPVKIIGGYNDDFTARDPWGDSKTIFSGDNKSKNWESWSRLDIDLSKYKAGGSADKLHVVVDGVIVDNVARNRYEDEKIILRKASPQKGENPSSDSPGIHVSAAKDGHVTIRNCIVANVAASGGALSIWGHRASKILISNNLMVNNTGHGIYAHTRWHGESPPSFLIESNTVMFTWKYDAFGTRGGNGLKVESGTAVVARANVFAFSDQFNVDNIKRCKDLTLKGNLFWAALDTDYREFDSKIALEDFEDEAELLSDDSEDNVKEKYEPRITRRWMRRYKNRKIYDRNKIEGEKKPEDGDEIEDKANVWLHKMKFKDVLKVGAKKVKDKYGCSKPEIK